MASNKLHSATLTMSDSPAVHTLSERLDSKVGREAACQTKEVKFINRSCHRHASWRREKKKFQTCFVHLLNLTGKEDAADAHNGY